MAETEIASFLATSNTVKNNRLLNIGSKYGQSRNKRKILAIENSIDDIESDLEGEKVKPVRTVRFKKEVTTVDPTLVRLKCALSKILTKLKSEDKFKRETGVSCLKCRY